VESVTEKFVLWYFNKNIQSDVKYLGGERKKSSLQYASFQLVLYMEIDSVHERGAFFKLIYPSKLQANDSYFV